MMYETIPHLERRIEILFYMIIISCIETDLFCLAFFFELGGGGEWGMIRMNGAQRNGDKEMAHEGNNEVVEEEKVN